MTLIFVCVFFGLATVAATLAVMLDRTRQNASDEIDRLDIDAAKLRAENTVLLDACDLHEKEHGETRKKLIDCEKKRIKGIEEMALDMTRLESQIVDLKDCLHEETTVREAMRDKIADLTVRAERATSALKGG